MPRIRADLLGKMADLLGKTADLLGKMADLLGKATFAFCSISAT